MASECWTAPCFTISGENTSRESRLSAQTRAKTERKGSWGEGGEAPIHGEHPGVWGEARFVVGVRANTLLRVRPRRMRCSTLGKKVRERGIEREIRRETKKRERETSEVSSAVTSYGKFLKLTIQSATNDHDCFLESLRWFAKVFMPLKFSHILSHWKLHSVVVILSKIKKINQ